MKITVASPESVSITLKQILLFNSKNRPGGIEKPKYYFLKGSFIRNPTATADEISLH